LDQELLLNQALSFFGFTELPTPNLLQARYRELARRFHPDAGEFTSPELFQELQKYHEALESALERAQNQTKENDQQIETRQQSQKREKEEFQLYKHAKDEETKALLLYFEKTNHLPWDALEARKQAHEILKKDLEPVLAVYEQLQKQQPPSIWSDDARRSQQRLAVWWK